MRIIEIKVPDEFTQKQEDFIKNSAISQIEAEMKSVLKIPQVDIDAVDVKVVELKIAMGIVTKVDEILPVKDIIK